MSRRSSQNSQFGMSGPPGPQRPDGRPVPRPAVTATSRAGTAKFFRLLPKAKRIDAGWRRCSDGIAGVSREQVRADGARHVVVETGDRHP
jgi:hypothetical protein